MNRAPTSDHRIRQIALKLYREGIYPSHRACAKRGVVCSVGRFCRTINAEWKERYGIAPYWEGPLHPQPKPAGEPRPEINHPAGKSERCLMRPGLREELIREHMKRIQAEMEESS
jgi:hypothetical protein